MDFPMFCGKGLCGKIVVTVRLCDASNVLILDQVRIVLGCLGTLLC